MSEQLPPLPLQSNESAQIKGSIVATWALAVIAVCLRFTARRLSKAGFWYDDWLMVPATVSIPHIKLSSNYVESLGEQIDYSYVYQLGAAALCFTSAFWSKSSGLY